MRLLGLSLAIATATLATAVATRPAIADCAEDLTRIQVAAPKASPDVRAVIDGLVATAQARTKAMDGAGCRAATAEALKLLGLATLPPLTLSTPVPGLDRQPHPPAPPPPSTAQAAPTPSAPSPGAQPPSDQAQKSGDATSAGPAAAPSSPATPSASAQRRNDWYVVTSDLIGKPVTSQDNPGDSLGVIKAIAIDSTTQQAVLALVETGGFLGIGGNLIAVPFSALMFNERWERPILQANTEVVQSGPRVTAGKITELLADPAWRREVSEHFGMPLVTPAAIPSTPSPSTTPPVAPRKSEAPKVVPAAPSAGDAAKGHAYVKQTCAGCHTFDANGGTRVGPNLYGVVGRPIASVAGFSYSQGLKRHGGVWDAASLNAFLQSPQHFASGTVMAFPGLPSGDDRANIIAYLKAMGTTQGAQK